MKSDVVKITNTGDGMDAAFAVASASALYRGLSKKEALHLRLLTEEMLGMVRQIAGQTEADFWAESTGRQFEIHLVAHPIMTGKMKKELLKVSSSGKNDAAKGFMGKIRDIIDWALMRDDTQDRPDYLISGMLSMDAHPMAYSFSPYMFVWSMNHYKTTIQDENSERSGAQEKWDELEKSIIANVADEIKIAFVGDKVEMTVYKDFDQKKGER